MDTWDKEASAAAYRARFFAIPYSPDAHHFWHLGLEDADTELLESARHRRILAEGREDEYPDTGPCSRIPTSIPVYGLFYPIPHYILLPIMAAKFLYTERQPLSDGAAMRRDTAVCIYSSM